MADELNTAPETAQQPSADSQDIDINSIPDQLPTEDVKGLKSTLEKYKKQVAQLKEYETLLNQGLTADQIQSQMQTLKQQQELQEQQERQMAELRAQYDQKHQESISEYNRRLQELQRSMAERDRQDEIKSIFEKGGAIPPKSDLDAQGRREYISHFLEFNEDNKVVAFRDPNGKKLFVDDKQGGVRDATVEDFVFKVQQGEYGEFMQAMFPPQNKASGSGLPAFSGSGMDKNGYIPLNPGTIGKDLGKMTNEELKAIRARGRMLEGWQF